MAHENISGYGDSNTLTRVHFHRIDTGDPDSPDGAVGIQTIRHGSGLYLPSQGPGGLPRLECAITTLDINTEEGIRHHCQTHDLRWESQPGEPAIMDCPSRPEPFDGWVTWHTREQVNRLIRVARKARDRAWGVDA